MTNARTVTGSGLIPKSPTAHEGLRKPVWYKGKLVGYETEYSDTLLLAVLKANNPDKFRDRIEQTNLLNLDPDKLSPEMLDKIAEHLLNKALDGNQRAVAEAKRRIEAGETVTVEAIETTLEAT